MKALSLTQPMAWAIFHGKNIENRTWPTKVRGRVMIHASKNFDAEDYHWLLDNASRLSIVVPTKHGFTFGALLGEVDIIDCVRVHASQWFFGPYGFVLVNPVLYDMPIPMRGQLGFFEVKL